MSQNLFRAVRINQHGGPEEMKIVEVSVGQPGPGEIRIRHQACGLNFIDVYQRSGVYALPLPAQLGMEAAGIIEAVGTGSLNTDTGERIPLSVKKGDRVIFSSYAGTEVKLDGKELLIMSEDDILAVID